MSKIEQNRAIKRQAILDAAKQTFLTEGYTSANMDKIAAQAKLTKQTLYRYFPSKIELFEATLQQIGQDYDERFSLHLTQENSEQALIEFANDFLTFHLSEEHLNTQRLLIAEAAQSPEIVESFMTIGSNETDQILSEFFKQNLALENPESYIELWVGMLLAPRSSALLGIKKLNHTQVREHAIKATELLLTAINHPR